MRIPDCSKDSLEVECGGFANVSLGTYEGRQVAIKVVRVYVTSDLDVIRSVSVLPTPLHSPHKPIAEILQGSGRLEAPPSPQYPAAAWGVVERIPVRSGFRVDGTRKHQRIRQGGLACKPRRACMLSLDLAALSLMYCSVSWCCEWLEIYA